MPRALARAERDGCCPNLVYWMACGVCSVCALMLVRLYHQERWGRWQSFASYADSLFSYSLRGSAAISADMVEAARIELFRSAASSTRLRCWDHRRRRSGRRRLRLRPPCTPSATESCGLRPDQLRQIRQQEQPGYELSRSKLLRPLDLIARGRSISVVGNGDAANMSGAAIDASDVVIRFNDFVLAPELTGQRTDVHVMNGNVRGTKSCRAPINIIVECKYYVRAPPDECRERRRLACMPTPETWKSLCFGHEEHADPTRGFLVLAMFRRRARLMRLFGFRGDGHWYDDPESARQAARSNATLELNDPMVRGRWAPAHRHDVEHRLLHSKRAREMATVV